MESNRGKTQTEGVTEANAWAVWQLGFRPFFLLGAFQGAATVLLWLLNLRSAFPLPAHFDPITWHAHEMLFGFVSAIIAGFVLTASQNWTGKRGVHGGRLQLVTLLWASARVTALVPGAGWAFAFFDLAFWPVLSWLLFPYLGQSKQKHNRVFFLFFGALFGANLALHAEALGFVSGWVRPSLMTALYVILLVIGLVGGRVIPFFTTYVIPEHKAIPPAWLERTIHPLTAAFAVAAVFFEFSLVTAVLGILTGLAHLFRLLCWVSVRARGIPILYILYLGYLWLPIGFTMKAFAALGLVAPTLATHALTVGAIGVIIYGMIARVSLGHTGRAITALPVIKVAFGSLLLAAVFRSLAPWVFPQGTEIWLDLSGALWILAFVLFLGRYSNWLMRPRPDGKPG